MTQPTPSAPDRAEASHRTKGLLRLTMACNERCPFCNVPAEDYAKLTPPQAEVDRQLDAFIEAGDRTLTITGGEPTLLKKRLLALTRSARDRGMDFVEIQTNATLIDDAYAQALAEAGCTSAFVSLLSHIPEHHDVLAGLPGAFAKCMTGIDALLDHNIRVALNPVLARRTQAHFADFVQFVVDRLPRVRSVSVSAVQPHGRAGRGDNTEELLPDYDVLAEQIPKARAIASAAGLELLNPYCGLPLCVGWTDDPTRCVEAVEAATGGWRPTPGIENRGDKHQGAPCRDCAWRTRCGGAWHATWALRDGQGLHPPQRSKAPWLGGENNDAQTIVDARIGLDLAALQALGTARTPTVWLWATALPKGGAKAVSTSGCTDLALVLDPRGLSSGQTPKPLLRTLRELDTLLAQGRGAPDSGRLRVHLSLTPASEADLATAVGWATRAGVDRIRRARP